MTLDEIRARIDAVDKQMKELFFQRMDCAQQVAREKAKTGGDVFVPEREAAIIAARAGDAGELRAEYERFLVLLMSISRRYQYGLLPNMVEQVIAQLSGKAGVDPSVPHSLVSISFSCGAHSGALALFANAAQLNGVVIDSMQVESAQDGQRVAAVLRGNLQEETMRRLLCQLAKELPECALTGVR